MYEDLIYLDNSKIIYFSSWKEIDCLMKSYLVTQRSVMYQSLEGIYELMHTCTVLLQHIDILFEVCKGLKMERFCKFHHVNHRATKIEIFFELQKLISKKYSARKLLNRNLKNGKTTTFWDSEKSK